jgi:hypothetical protein
MEPEWLLVFKNLKRTKVTKSGSLWVALPPPAHHSDGVIWCSGTLSGGNFMFSEIISCLVHAYLPLRILDYPIDFGVCIGCGDGRAVLSLT